jgi:hypothetical protein
MRPDAFEAYLAGNAPVRTPSEVPKSRMISKPTRWGPHAPGCLPRRPAARGFHLIGFESVLGLEAFGGVRTGAPPRQVGFEIADDLEAFRGVQARRASAW